MGDSLNSTLSIMKDLHLEGNIIPIQWFQHISYENGKPDTNAILLLSDIVYWYRPRIVRDEQTGHVLGYQKKFKADLLQKNYQDYETLFGFSKKQIREAFIHLEELGLIKRIFRTIETDFGPRGNVMYIDINPLKVAEISLKVPPLSLEVNRGFPERKEGIPSKEIAISLKGKTYTETTPKTTTKILSSPPTPQSEAEFNAGGEEKREWNHGFMEEIYEVSSSTAAEISHRESPLSSEGKRVFPQRNRAVTAGVGDPHQTLTLSKEERVETREDQMVRIWNAVVQKDLAGRDTKTRPAVCLTVERTQALRKIHQDLCDGDVSLWEMACHTIAASKFLMGEVPGTRFKISFDWFLKPANFLKVLEGGFTSGDRGLDKTAPKGESALQAFLKGYNTDPALHAVLREIATLVGTTAFLNWFAKAAFSLASNHLTIQAPTRFMRDWIATHYFGTLQTQLKGVSSIDLCVGETTQ